MMIRARKIAGIIVFGVFVFFTYSADAATLFIVSKSDRAALGDTIGVSVRADSGDQTMNAAQGTIQFSRDVLEVASVSRTNSIFNVWLADPSVNVVAGEITFLGGSTNAFGGKSLPVLDITFKVRGAGMATIAFKDAAITAGDGTGANILSESIPFSIVAVGAGDVPAITPAPPPVQIQRTEMPATGLPERPSVMIPLYSNPARWYAVSSLFFVNWQLPRDITGVTAVVNKNPDFVPETSEGLFESKQFSQLADGVWYAHVRFLNSVGWGSTAHTRIGVDTTPPSAFSITADGAATSDPQPRITFRSGDALSGIDHYEIRINGGESIITASTTFLLPLQTPGERNVRVRAIDKAVNTAEASLKLNITPIDSPTINPVKGSLFTGEGGIILSGSAEPGGKVLLRIRDRSTSEVVFDSSVVADDSGNWVARFDEPLRKGSYVAVATAEDERGALSNDISTPVFSVRERPVFSVGGIGITLEWFTVLLALILIGVFAGGIFWGYHRYFRMLERTTIAQRDVLALAENIKANADKALKAVKAEHVAEHEIADIEYALNGIKENADKLDKYAIGGIEDIVK